MTPSLYGAFLTLTACAVFLAVATPILSYYQYRSARIRRSFSKQAWIIRTAGIECGFVCSVCFASAVTDYFSLDRYFLFWIAALLGVAGLLMLSLAGNLDRRTTHGPGAVEADLPTPHDYNEVLAERDDE